MKREEAKAMIVRLLSRSPIGNTEHGDLVEFSENSAQLLADAIGELIEAYLKDHPPA